MDRIGLANNVIGMAEKTEWKLRFKNDTTGKIVENPTEMGSYTVFLSVPEGSNYEKRGDIKPGSTNIVLQIVAASLDKSKVEAIIEGYSATYNGEEQAVNKDTMIKVTLDGKVLTEGYTIGEITYKNQTDNTTTPKNAGKYTVTIPITLSNYANNESGSNGVFTITREIEIEKANPEYEVPSGLTAEYGETLADVELPTVENGTFTWVEGTETSVGNAGENTFHVKFTPKDTVNYNTIESIEVKVTVSKINPEYEVPSGLTAEYGETLADVELPTVENGTFTWVEGTETSVGNAGENTFHVKFTPKDTVNYNTIESIEVKVIVSQADTDIPEESKLPEKPTNPDDPENQDYADYEATYGDLLSKYASTGDADKKLPAGWTFDAITDDNKDVLTVGSATKDGKTPAIYEFAVTYKGDENHKDVKDTVKIKVVKADNAPVLPTDAYEATYGDLLSTITLPNGWAFNPIFEGEEGAEVEVQDPTVGNAGTNTFNVTYTPEDPDNYNTASGTVTVNVARKDVSDKPLEELVDISIEMDEELVYNGTTREPVITPKTDVTVSKEITYSKYDKEAGSYKQIAEIPSDVGDYRAIIKIEGSENYTGSIGEETVYYSITQRPITIKPTSQSGDNATATYGDENIEVKQGEYTYTTATTENAFGLLEELGHKLEGVILITPTLTEARSKGLYDIEVDPENVKIVVKTEGTDAIVKDVTANYIINYEKLEDGFEIKPKSIEAPNFDWSNALTWPDGRTFTYTGNNQGVSINPPSPLVLNQDIEAIITYKKGDKLGSAVTVDETKDVGTYWVTVKIIGKGNYTGEVNLNNGEAISFEIIKAPAELLPNQIPTLTVEYGQTLADVKMIKGTGAEAVFENRPWTLWDEDGNALGIFDYNDGTDIKGDVGTVENPAKVILKYTSANANYSPVTCEVTLVVTQATPNVKVPTGIVATYGDLLSSVNLGEGWTFDDITDENKDTLTVGDATLDGEEGTAFDITYTPTDPNYKAVTGKTVIIKVNKKAQTEPEISLVNAIDDVITDNSILMIDKETKVKVSNAGEAGEGINYNVTAGTAVTVSNTGAITPVSIGTAKITVTFPGNNNYLPAEKEIEITVTKANLVEGNFKIDGENTNIYSGSAYAVNIIPADGIVCENNNVAVTPIIKYNGNTEVPVNAGTYTVTIDVPESENYEAKSDLLVGTMTIEKAQISSLERAEHFLNISLNTDNEYEWTGSEIALVDSIIPKFDTDKEDITLENSIKYYLGGTQVTGVPSELGIYTAYLQINSKNIETIGNRGIELGSYKIKDTTAPTFTLNTTKASISENSEEEFPFDIHAAGTDNHDGNVTATWTGEIEKNANGSYKLGTYEITFTLKDSSGNMTTKIVEVTVIEAPPRIYYKDTTQDTGNRWDLLDETVQNKFLNNPYAGSLPIEWNRGSGTIYKTNDNGKTWVVSEYGSNLPAKTTVNVGKGGYYKVVVIEPGLEPVEAMFKISDQNPVYKFSDNKGRNELIALYGIGDVVTFTIENPETVKLLRIIPENDPDFKEVNLSSFGTGAYTYQFTGPNNLNEYAAYQIYITTVHGKTIYVGEVFYCDLAALRNQ